MEEEVKGEKMGKKKEKRRRRMVEKRRKREVTGRSDGQEQRRWREG